MIEQALRMAVSWAATFCIIAVILATLYMAARLVFHAWFRTKKHFNEGGKDHGEEKQT